MLQSVAVCCSVLRHDSFVGIVEKNRETERDRERETPTHKKTDLGIKKIIAELGRECLFCGVLQCVAVCCSVLQFVCSVVHC